MTQAPPKPKPPIDALREVEAILADLAEDPDVMIGVLRALRVCRAMLAAEAR